MNDAICIGTVIQLQYLCPQLYGWLQLFISGGISRQFRRSPQHSQRHFTAGIVKSVPKKLVSSGIDGHQITRLCSVNRIDLFPKDGGLRNPAFERDSRNGGRRIRSQMLHLFQRSSGVFVTTGALTGRAAASRTRSAGMMMA